MKILLLCDDYYHPGEVVVEGLSYLSKEYDLTIIKDTKDFSIEMLKLYPLVILGKSNNHSKNDQTDWLTPNIEAGFLEYVENGNSLFVLHSGIAGYQKNILFKKLIGGSFVQHPEQCLVQIKPVNDDIAITKGTVSFEVLDEHYFVELEKDITIFLHTISSYGTQAGGWVKKHGEGWVCVLTPGHNPSVWKNEYYQNIISNSIQWLLKQ